MQDGFFRLRMVTGSRSDWPQEVVGSEVSCFYSCNQPFLNKVRYFIRII